jgi:NADPH:quinone reductase-like Zn-dependent oxidoreductase
MRAYVQSGHGGPEVCGFENVTDPTPAPGEVVVRVRACALNRLDLLQRAAPLVRGFRLPHIAGMDVVGEVVAHGASRHDTVMTAMPPIGAVVLVDPVTTCRTCDRCRRGLEPYCETLQTIGSTRNGGFAEFVAVPGDRCWLVPDHLDDVHAAALPVASITAWRAVVSVGQVSADDVVLVNGANAGTSIAAIQLAKRAGARVIGTARGAAKVAAAIACGCDDAIDATDPAAIAPAVMAMTDGHGADLVIDHVGPAQFEASVDAMALEGRMVFCGTTTGTEVSLPLTSVYWWGRRLLGAGGYRPADFGDMLAVVAESRLIPVVDTASPFADLPVLLDRLAGGSVVGKLVTVLPG